MQLNHDICYRAVQARDARFDGQFFTAVSSTGIYCRPICPAITPKPENCTFFACAAAAHEAGYRPCLRCRPEISPDLSASLGGSGIASTLAVALGNRAVQDRLLRVVNVAAAQAASAAAPVIYESIRTMSFSDAIGLVRGGPTAATDYLQRSLGTAIVDAMFPGIGPALRLFDNGVVNQLAQAATGMTFTGLQRHVAEEAAQGIYKAIGREEAAMRANPASVDDPMIRRLFGPGR